MLKSVPRPSVLMCESPPTLENGAVEVTEVSIGSEATYSCNAGYEFSTTETTRTCLNDGMWSTEEIVCVEGEMMTMLIMESCSLIGL